MQVLLSIFYFVSNKTIRISYKPSKQLNLEMMTGIILTAEKVATFWRIPSIAEPVLLISDGKISPEKL